MNQINANILLAEDDQNLGFVLNDFLEILGHKVVWCHDGQEALKELNDKSFDICILDVMMPKLDGFNVAKELRKFNTEIPIIFLTAKSEKEDRIEGLLLGADDYITKPFSTEELGLRIQAILRRTTKSESATERKTNYTIGNYSFDPINQLLVIDNEEKRLTKKESALLKILASNMGQLNKREQMLKEVWGDDDYFMGRSMDVYIVKLRKYLKKDSRININNIHGTGFILEVAD
jgi:DNA-binding response OmpR family regulator